MATAIGECVAGPIDRVAGTGDARLPDCSGCQCPISIQEAEADHLLYLLLLKILFRGYLKYFAYTSDEYKYSKVGFIVSRRLLTPTHPSSIPAMQITPAFVSLATLSLVNAAAVVMPRQ